MGKPVAGITDTVITDLGRENGWSHPGVVLGGSGIWREERLAHFIRMLSNEDDGKRWHAAESVGRMRDPGAVEPLIDKLRDHRFRTLRK
jgi:hypothetical protein